MGRFYKTASANPLDYMYRQNTPLMERVISANDAFIDNTNAEASQYYNLASFNHLIGDSEDAQAITSQYRKMADEITNNIAKNPAEWRKHLPALKNLSRKLQTEYQEGKISKLLGNYNTRKQGFDDIDKQVELYYSSGGTKGISPDRASAYKNNFDSSFERSYSPDGKFNPYQVRSVAPDMDYRKILDEELAKVKKDKNAIETSELVGSNAYFNDTTKEWEGVSPEKLLKVAWNRLQDSDMMKHMANDAQVGYLRGAFDAEGNFIAPFNTSKKGQLDESEKSALNKRQDEINKLKRKDPKAGEEAQAKLDAEVAEIENQEVFSWNNKSFLSPVLQGLISKYSESSTTSKNHLRNNSLANTIRSGQDAMARTRYTQGQQNWRMLQGFGQEKDMEKIRHENKMKEVKKALGKTKDGDGKDVDTPVVGGLPIEGAVVGSGAPKDAKEAVTNITGRITNTKREIATLTAKLNSVASPEEKKSLITQLQTLNAQINNDKTRLQQAETDAKKDLFKGPGNRDFDELSHYNQYTKEFNDELARARAGGLKIYSPKEVQSIIDKTGKPPAESERLKVLRERQTRMNANLQKLASTRNKYLLKAEQENTNEVQFYTVSSDTQEDLRQGMSLDGSKYHIMDFKGDNADITFDKYKSGDKSKFVDPSTVKILGAAPSATNRYGGDVIMAVEINGEKYLVATEDKSTAKDKIVTDWKNSGNESAVKVANKVDNQIYNTIADVVRKPIQGSGDIGAATTTIVPLSTGEQMTVHITPHKRGSDWSNPYWSVEIKNQDGSWSKTQRPFYNNESEIATDLNEINNRLIEAATKK